MNHVFSDATAFFPDCSDHIVWMYRDELYGFTFEVMLFVVIDGKFILHELQCCQKEKCTLQSQTIGQNIVLEYFTIFILRNLSRTGKKTMNIAQRSHFDRSCRSGHVTRACKQALLAQLG